MCHREGGANFGGMYAPDGLHGLSKRAVLGQGHRAQRE